jgi:3-hydroxyacyl-[acyl-carrier-protein] dehydratase
MPDAAGASPGAFSLGTPVILWLMPRCYPVLLLDRLRGWDAAAVAGHGVTNITITDPLLRGHFPERPIYPGVLVIEALFQTACMTATLRALHRHFGSDAALLTFLASRPAPVPPVAKPCYLAESRMKHTQPVGPGDVLEMQAALLQDRDGALVFKVAATVQGREAARGQVTIAAAPAAGKSA